MDKKLDNISLIKTFMMFAVVLYHSCCFFGGDWFTVIQPAYHFKLANLIIKFFRTFHTQAFTMASGYLFFYLWIEKKKYLNLKESIWRKFKRLVVPYFFTCIVWVIPISYYFYRYTFNQIFYRYILMVMPNQLWFLIMLFGVFCVFFFIKEKVLFSKLYFIIVYIITTLISSFLLKYDINYFQIARIIEYILYFYLGGYIYIHRDRIDTKQLPLITILILLMMVVINYLENDNDVIYFLSELIKAALSVCELVVIYVLCTKCSFKFDCDNKFYKVLEKNSFGVYLFHQQFIYFCILLLNGRVLPIIQVLLSFFISIIASILICTVLKRNKYTRKVFGL